MFFFEPLDMDVPVFANQQGICADTGCSLEDLLGAMDIRDGWWERARKIHATSTTWWWIIGTDGERESGKSMLPAQFDDW